MSEEKVLQKLSELLTVWGKSVCESLTDDLYEYSLGRLEGEQKTVIERHLELCETCAAIHREFTASLAEEANESSAASSLGQAFGWLVPKVKNWWDEVTVRGQEWAGSMVMPPGALREMSPGESVPIEEDNHYRLHINPIRDGYVTVFLSNNKGDVWLCYPRTTSDDTFLVTAQERDIFIATDLPVGRYMLKVIYTSSKLFDIKKVDISDIESLSEQLENFLREVKDMPDSNISIGQDNFEVIVKK